MHDLIRRAHRIPEAEAVARLRTLQPDGATSKKITAAALRLAQRVRASPPAALSAESFLRHYGLSTREGVPLFGRERCCASRTRRDALLREKLLRASGGRGDSWVAAPQCGVN